MLGEYLFMMIDGTGPVNEEQYRSEFKDSFLSQINDSRRTRTAYYEGPSVSGQDLLSNIVGPATRNVMDYAASNPGNPILLAGYSRGGAGVMEVAKNCSGLYGLKPIPIQEMILLDPVSKWDGCPGGVSSNVGRVFAMFRDQNSVHVSPWISTKDQRSRWDKAAVLAFGCKDKDRYARRFMENADTSLLSGNTTTKRWVNGDGVIRGASHGALGGTPWPERKADQTAVGEVAFRLNQWLKLCGVTAQVSNKVAFYSDAKDDDQLLAEARFQDFAYHENGRRARAPRASGQSSSWPPVTKDDPMWLRVKDTYRTSDE